MSYPATLTKQFRQTLTFTPTITRVPPRISGAAMSQPADPASVIAAIDERQAQAEQHIERER
jgi:hypothetical protein